MAVAGVSPRQDSASGRQAGRRPDVDEPFSQPMVRQRLSPDRLATSFAGRPTLLYEVTSRGSQGRCLIRFPFKLFHVSPKFL